MDRLRTLHHAVALLAAACLTCWAAADAQAQGITVLDRRNDSTPASLLDLANAASAFDSDLQVSRPTLSDHVAQLDLHFSWQAAALAGPLPSGLVNLFPALGWSLTLRVDDPLDQGYTLRVDGLLRGVLAASMDSAGTSNALLSRLDVEVFEPFATTPRLLPGVSTGDLGVDQFNAGDERREIRQRGSDTVGRYVGTRSFLFFVQPLTSVVSALTATPGNNGYAWQQFGQAAPNLRLSFANPQPGDPVIEDLGQFLRFSAEFNAAPVPEPGTWALLAAGLGVVVLRGYRRPRRG
jgi:hypothetical protein